MDLSLYFQRTLQAAAPAVFFLFFSLGWLVFAENRKGRSALSYLHLDFAYWKKPAMVRQMLVHSAILFLGLLAISAALSLFSSLAGVSDINRIQTLLGAQPWTVLVIAFTLSPVAEEIFFRGFLQKKIGLPFSAVVFAALHYIYGSWVEVAGALGVAVLLGLYVRREKNLFPPILAHALFNLLSVLVLFA